MQADPATWPTISDFVALKTLPGNGSCERAGDYRWVAARRPVHDILYCADAHARDDEMGHSTDGYGSTRGSLKKEDEAVRRKKTKSLRLYLSKSAAAVFKFKHGLEVCQVS